MKAYQASCPTVMLPQMLPQYKPVESKLSVLLLNSMSMRQANNQQTKNSVLCALFAINSVYI